ncbi:MAG: hypothetical protein Q8R13_03580 [bacterium]|nr:hypothetical protein [bacterium]MDZ4296439.1 hypothetical protein [Patescibacteria group bacterium]
MERTALIKEIEAARGARVITYITSDRQGPVNARIAMDVIPVLGRTLARGGKTERLDLFLYSAGGDTMVPWRLVSMLREYCDVLAVLVPYKAHSAATMVALGADEIVMSNLSELSPIDPSTANVFNPSDPQNPQNRIPISVEDVMAYFDLAKNKFGIKDESQLAHIFGKFIDANPQIHPLALGNINRIHNLIRILARRLLKSHNTAIAGAEIEKIVDDFTEKLYSHQYFIGRKEAREDLGLHFVRFADGALADRMTELYEAYKAEMALDTLWNPENELGEARSSNKKDYSIAFIETAERSSRFELSIEYKRSNVNVVQQTPQGPVQIPQEQVVWRVVSQGWRYD